MFLLIVSVTKSSANTAFDLHKQFRCEVDFKHSKLTSCRRGLTVAFGAWQEYLSHEFLSHYNESAISWIGTVQGFLMVFVGVAIGPLFDLGYIRLLTVSGMVLNVLGFMLASISHQYYSTFLSLGALVGLGGACLFTPGVAIVAQYFTTKRSTAIGLAAAGGSTGA